jgi:phage protein D
MKYFGSFTVDEVGINLKPATMTVTAKSTDFNSTSTEKERHDKEWENVSLGDIVEKVAAKFGYDFKVDANVNYSHVSQTNESDLSFLERVVNKIGAKLAVRDKTIVVSPPNKGTRTHVTIQYDEAVSGSFSANAREGYGEVEAKWWESAGATEKKVTSKRKKKSKEKWYHSAGDGAKLTLQGSYASASEAQTVADNYMAMQERGEFTGDLALPGRVDIVADAEITLSGFKPESVNGRYIAKSVNHSITKSGWTVSVNLESLG